MTSPETVERTSILTCPECGHRKAEEMPLNACIVVYDCEGCGVSLSPKSGDCCVFCSYGTFPCPPVQIDGRCC